MGYGITMSTTIRIQGYTDNPMTNMSQNTALALLRPTRDRLTSVTTQNTGKHGRHYTEATHRGSRDDELHK